MLAVTTCNICSRPDTLGPESEVAYVRSNIRRFRDQRFAVWRCRSCGSIHARDEVDLDYYYRHYPFYERAPRMWDLSAQTDQQIAGGIMKLIGSLVLWGFIAVVFFQWYNREQAAEKEPHWNEVQEELHEMGLTRE